MREFLTTDFKQRFKVFAKVGVIVLAIVILILGVVAPWKKATPAHATVSWMDFNWTHRSVITVDHTKVGTGGVTNYPVLITEANIPAGVWAQAKADGSDLRMTASDGTTEINFELVTFTPGTPKTELWFLASNLSSSVDTTFYLYWGNAGASAKAASWGQGVWTNYAGVWHMQATAWSGTPGEVTDSSGAGVVGQAVGDATPAAAVIGTGLSGSRWTHNTAECIALHSGRGQRLQHVILGLLDYRKRMAGSAAICEQFSWVCNISSVFQWRRV